MTAYKVTCDNFIDQSPFVFKDNSYYYPAINPFGEGWYHVRRISAQNSPGNWIKLANSNGNLISDSLFGDAVSTSFTEIKTFYDGYSYTRTQQGQFTRYFKPWIVEEYLIVTGNRIAWIRFTKSALQTAYSTAVAANIWPGCIPLDLTSSSINPNPHQVTAVFINEGSNGIGILIGLFNGINCNQLDVFLIT